MAPNHAGSDVYIICAADLRIDRIMGGEFQNKDDQKTGCPRIGLKMRAKQSIILYLPKSIGISQNSKTQGKNDHSF